VLILAVASLSLASKYCQCSRIMQQPFTAGGPRSLLIRARMPLKNDLDRPASAIWKMAYRAWRTRRQPVLMSRSRSEVSDQLSTAFVVTEVRSKFARL